MSDSKGSLILTALKTRLESITLAHGYRVDIKEVKLNTIDINMNYPSSDLPKIAILNDKARNEQAVSAQYVNNMNVWLQLVAEPEWTDLQMEDFKSDIRQALFGDSPSASGNTGITLGGKITRIDMGEEINDLHMLKVNRVSAMQFTLVSHRISYRD